MRAEAVATSRAVIAHHSKSFALAARLLPPGVRDRASVVYAWCRRADDAVDDVGRADAAAAVARLSAELDRVYAGEPAGDPVLDAFAEVISAARIPRDYPAELLAGMEMDARGHVYAGWEDLLRYSYRVAGTVGLMMSHVMGLSRGDALRNAAHLGIAMQLTNICRDVREDWDRDRLYIPDAVLERFGAGDLRARLGRPLPVAAKGPLAGAIAELLRVADDYYASGDRGLSALSPRCAWAVAAARRVYAAIGARVRASGCDVFAPRAVVSKPEKLRLVAAATASAAVAGRRGGDRASAELPRIEFPDDVLVSRVGTIGEVA